jgi:hypothetical protein
MGIFPQDCGEVLEHVALTHQAPIHIRDIPDSIQVDKEVLSHCGSQLASGAVVLEIGTSFDKAETLFLTVLYPFDQRLCR